MTIPAALVATLSLDEAINLLVHKVVIGGYEDRARHKRLTGEWLVYAQ